MKKYFFRLIIALFILAVPLLAEVYKGDVDRFTLPELQAKGAVIVDVRTPAEWRDTGIIPGSIRITYMDNEGRVDKKAFIKAIEENVATKHDTVVLVCRTGVRSKKAAEWLAKEGYDNIYNKTHGIKECMRYNRDKLTKNFY
jgi:rhodanese-related sulfurtransferase